MGKYCEGAYEVKLRPGHIQARYLPTYPTGVSDGGRAMRVRSLNRLFNSLLAKPNHNGAKVRSYTVSRAASVASMDPERARSFTPYIR